MYIFGASSDDMLGWSDMYYTASAWFNTRDFNTRLDDHRLRLVLTPSPETHIEARMSHEDAARAVPDTFTKLRFSVALRMKTM